LSFASKVNYVANQIFVNDNNDPKCTLFIALNFVLNLIKAFSKENRRHVAAGLVYASLSK